MYNNKGAFLNFQVKTLTKCPKYDKIFLELSQIEVLYGSSISIFSYTIILVVELHLKITCLNLEKQFL